MDSHVVGARAGREAGRSLVERSARLGSAVVVLAAVLGGPQVAFAERVGVPTASSIIVPSAGNGVARVRATTTPVCGAVVPATATEPQRRARGSFNLSANSDLTLDFGSDRDRRELQLEYDLVGCRFTGNQRGGSINVSNPTFVDADGRALVGGLRTGGEIIDSQRIRVTIRVDPDNNESDAGTYRAPVEIISSAAQLTTTPIVITLRYANPVLVFLTFMLPITFLGTVIVWIKSVISDSTDNEYSAKGYWAWLKRPGNLLAIIAGLIAARVAFGDSFYGDRSWGASSHGVAWLWPVTSDEWWSLALLVSTAFTGAFTVATLPGDAVNQAKKSSPTEVAGEG